MKTLFSTKRWEVLLERYPDLLLFFGKDYIFIQIGWLRIEKRRKV